MSDALLAFLVWAGVVVLILLWWHYKVRSLRRTYPAEGVDRRSVDVRTLPVHELLEGTTPCQDKDVPKRVERPRDRATGTSPATPPNP